MKLIVLVATVLLLSIKISFSQEDQLYTLRTEKIKDSLYLRIIPNSAEGLYNLIKNELSIKVINWNNENSVSEPDFNSAKENRYDSYSSNSSTINSDREELVSTFLEEYESEDEKSSKFLYGLILVESMNYPSFGKSIKNLFSFGIQLKNEYAIQLNQGKKSFFFISNDTKIAQLNFNPVVGYSEESKALVKWEPKKLERYYFSYEIEKSSTKKGEFIRLNEKPMVQILGQDEIKDKPYIYVDTNVVEGNTYYYNVYANSIFGRSVKFQETIEIYIPKKIVAELKIDSVLADGLNRNISVSLRSKNDTQLDFKGYGIMRSDSIFEGYDLIDKVNSSEDVAEFTFESKISSGDRNYFKAFTWNEDGDTIYSEPYYFFTYDQIPPEPVQAVEGIIDSLGIARIRWSANLETDLRGYRVFRGNTKTEEFIEVNRVFVQTPLFSDTLNLNTLTTDIYYFILATDNNYNSSVSSDTVLLIKPDTIAPVPSIIIGIYQSIDSLKVSWINSDSEDIGQQYLLRNSKKTVDTIHKWKTGIESFLDQTAIQGNTYKYQILTEDKSKNTALSEPYFCKYETGIRPPLKNINAEVDRLEKRIKISWEKPSEKLYSYTIYRQKNNGRFATYKTLTETSINEFIDTDLSISNTYSYKIQATLMSGISTINSEPIVVKY